MTGRQLFNTALRLTGLDETADRSALARLRKMAPVTVNEIVAELFACEHPGETFTPVSDLDAALPISEQTARTAAPYGVLMLLCAADGSVGDGAVYAALYDRKRAAVAAPAATRADVLPRGWDA